MGSLELYGAKVDVVKAPLGGVVEIEAVEKALRKALNEGSRRGYKMVTVTHVDTSTGVLSDARAIAACVRKTSPGTLVCILWVPFHTFALSQYAGGSRRGVFARIGGCANGQLGARRDSFCLTKGPRRAPWPVCPHRKSANRHALGRSSEARRA